MLAGMVQFFGGILGFADRTVMIRRLIFGFLGETVTCFRRFSQLPSETTPRIGFPMNGKQFISILFQGKLKLRESAQGSS